MPRITSILLLLLLLLAVVSSAASAQTVGPAIDILTIDGTIGPVFADYIKRGIEQAELQEATTIIIQMDTPGGLDSSMREIIQLMGGTQIPVVVYIPPGARAASAGFFITIAADVAAMAPDTAIGAATPVSLGGDGEVDVSDALEAKILNDAIAYARAIANAHGRNVEWAEKAVREAASVPAYEALELNVIDLIATSLDDLITQLDGWQVTMLDGSVVTLKTQGATVIDIEFTAIESFLLAISDPNIAYILLSLAILGITAEIFNPGLIFPGVFGAIAGLLAFFSLGMLPVNLAGILLILLAVGLFITEVFTTTFGILTAGGIVSLVIGSLILFEGGPLFQVDPVLIAVVAITIAGMLAFVINRVMAAHRRQAATGREELVGKTAVVRTALTPEGSVFHEGEIWTAELDTGQAEPGEEVIITKSEGLKLYVTKIK
jgi:membrane-bound serine protease (ClpP class)